MAIPTSDYRLDFLKLCQDKRIPYREEGHHHCHAGWVQIHCPFCTDGTYGWHLGFNLLQGNFNCWRCGSFSAWDVLVQLFGKEIAKQLMAQYHAGAPNRPPVKTRKRMLYTPPGIGSLESCHKRYLKRRGYDPDQLEQIWELKGTRHLSKDWSWRIVIPIKDKDVSTVAYCGRTLAKDVKPKYKMSNNEHILISPRQLLYGIHLAQGDTVVIVEGPADVWRLGPGAVATLGIDWKIEQANLLRQFSHRVVMFDPDDAAQRKAQKLADWLSLYNGNTELVTGLSCDPGDLPQDEADQMMKELLK